MVIFSLLISGLSRTISRVMSKLWQATVGMIIYLGRLLPAASSNLPKAGGPRQRFCSVLLRMGFTYALSVTREAVVSYTALPPLPGICRAVYFCCTILRVASTGRYPASCPVKPGLSSPRYTGRDHLSYLNPSFASRHILPARHPINYTLFFLFVQACFSYTLKHEPPINSRMIEFCPIPSGDIGRK